MASSSGVQDQFLAIPGWHFLIECFLIGGCGYISHLSLKELKLGSLKPPKAKNDLQNEN